MLGVVARGAGYPGKINKLKKSLKKGSIQIKWDINFIVDIMDNLNFNRLLLFRLL